MSCDDTLEESERHFEAGINAFMCNKEQDYGKYKLTHPFHNKFNRYCLKLEAVVSGLYIEEKINGSAEEDRWTLSFLRFYNVFSLFGSNGDSQQKEDGKCPKRYYLTLISCCYVVSHCILICYYHIVYDGLRSRLHPDAMFTSEHAKTLYSHNNLTKRVTFGQIDVECARPENIIDLDLVRQMDSMRDNIYYLGSCGLNSSMLIAHLTSLLCIIWAILISSALGSRREHFRVDATNFKRNPILAQRRLRKSLENMIVIMSCPENEHSPEDKQHVTKTQIPSGISINHNGNHKVGYNKLQPESANTTEIECLNPCHQEFRDYLNRANSRQCRSSLDCIKTSLAHALQEQSQLAYQKSRLFSPLETAHLSENSLSQVCNEADSKLMKSIDCNERKEQTTLMLFVRENNLIEHIRPASVTAEAHLKMLKMTTFWILSFQSFVGVLGLYLVYSIFMIELRARAETRLEKFYCEALLPPNGTLVRDMYRLDQFDYDWERDLYRELNIKGTTEFKNMWLILYVELRHMIGRKFAILIIELILFFIGIASCFTFYVSLLSDTHNYTMIWVKQIHNQLVACNDLLQHYSHLRKLDFNGTRRKQLAKALTITYLNFSLFMIEFKHARKLINFLVATIFAVCIGITTNSYIIFSVMVSRTMSIIWSTNLLCLVCANTMLYSCGLLTKEIERSFDQLAKLMATASENSMERCLIISMLRTQIISNRQVSQLYSIKAFELLFSHGFMINFNSYLLFLGLFIWRSINFP